MKTGWTSGLVAMTISGAALLGAGHAWVDDPVAKPTGQGKEKTVESKNGMAVCEADFEALKFLAADEGVWDADITFWLRPGAEPIQTKAVCTAKMVLSGMYLEQVFEGGDFGKAMPGMKWTSRSYTGFNTSTRQIEAIRLASTTSTMIPVKGAYDPKTKTVTLSGEYMLMNATATQRDVGTILGEDERRIDTFMSFGDSPEFKGASMTLKRRK